MVAGHTDRIVNLPQVKKIRIDGHDLKFLPNMITPQLRTVHLLNACITDLPPFDLTSVHEITLEYCEFLISLGKLLALSRAPRNLVCSRVRFEMRENALRQQVKTIKNTHKDLHASFKQCSLLKSTEWCWEYMHDFEILTAK